MKKFVAVGNVSIDKNLQDLPVCGGSVLYSSLLASMLGWETTAITSFGKDFSALKSNWHNIHLHNQARPHTTTFNLVYGKKGDRKIVLEKEGGIISADRLPKEIYDADIIFFCPIAHEISPKLVSFIAKENKGGVIVTTPQGWLRRWEKEGDQISQKSWDTAKEILSYTDILIISEEDINKNNSLLNKYKTLIKSGGMVILTQGSKGATGYKKNEAIVQRAYPAKAIDPTGAGDIFAASFGIAWKETFSMEQSLIFANTAASFVIEGIGASNIPTRDQIQLRGRRVKIGG